MGWFTLFWWFIPPYRFHTLAGSYTYLACTNGLVHERWPVHIYGLVETYFSAHTLCLVGIHGLVYILWLVHILVWFTLIGWLVLMSWFIHTGQFILPMVHTYGLISTLWLVHSPYGLYALVGPYTLLVNIQ